MLSKNNFNEKIRQMDEKKERFSIRKLTVGAASVSLVLDTGVSVVIFTAESSAVLIVSSVVVALGATSSF